jgi:hypothetical protein
MDKQEILTRKHGPIILLISLLLHRTIDNRSDKQQPKEIENVY